MKEQEATYCKNCHMLIIFIRTENGKLMPCNVNPVPYQEYDKGETSVYTRSGKRVRCTLNCSKDNCSGYGYVPHFGSCLSNEGRKRLDGYREQVQERKEPASIGRCVLASSEGSSSAEKKPEPQFEQMSLFGERRYRHPI